MKCPGCGAEIETGKICSYCGTQISLEMQKEQEQINKKGCPACGSTNIQFSREKQGEVRNKNSKRVIHRTVGFCKDCGHTWYPSAPGNVQKNNSMVPWILGWIFFFPAPVMVLIWRKKNTWDLKVKIAVTVVFWVVLFLYSMLNPNKSSVTSESKKNVNSMYSTEKYEEQENVEDTSSTDVASESNLDEIFPYDEIINRYINRYNDANSDDNITSELAKRYYHHGREHEDQAEYSVDGFEVVLTHTYSDRLKIVIKEPRYPKLEEEDYREIFIKYSKPFDSALTDEQLGDYWKQLFEATSNQITFDEFECDLTIYNDKVEMIVIEGEIS